LRYQLAIFDFDGTLHDSLPWFMGVMDKITDRHGLRRIGSDEVEVLRGRTTREIIAQLAVPMWKLPVIARDVRRLKAASLAGIPLFPGVQRMLEELAAKSIVTAIVSSDDETNVRRALGPANIDLIRYFACGASLLGKSRQFRRVLRMADIPAAQAIAIGDETRDAEAARKAGMAFGAVAWGYATCEALRAQSPDEMFFSLEEIAGRLV